MCIRLLFNTIIMCACDISEDGKTLAHTPRLRPVWTPGIAMPLP